GNARQRIGLQRRKPAKWKVRHVSNPLFSKRVDQRIILPVSDIVEILDANNWRDRLRLGDLLGGDRAYPEVLYKTLLLHVREHAEWLRYRTWLRCIQAADPQIDDIECITTEVHEVIVNGLPELVGGQRFGPISVRIPQRSYLGDDP